MNTKKNISLIVLTLYLILGGNSLGVEDPGWPREISANGAKLVIYQPQVDGWDNYTTLNARVAVSITPKGANEATLGALWVKADTQTNMETRTVTINNIEITKASFPSLNGESSEEMTQLVKSIFPKGPQTVALDRILANIERTKVNAKSANVSYNPPAIFVSQKPAILVLLDGEPVLSQIEGTDLMFVVNTNWDLFFQTGASKYYLLNGDVWLAATDLKGAWGPAGQLPASLSRLPKGQNWDDVLKHIPGRTVEASEGPVVFVSFSPAELIAIQGTPQFTPIPDTKLLYVKNTESDLFLDSANQNYYYLVSGRWFGAKSLDGPWSSVDDNLPGDFAKIPPDNPRASVLASVSGTPEAQEALILAQIPRTATVKRSEATVNVTYDGKPQFKPIESTSMSYAVNTSYDVIRVGDSYYVCYQGIWFVSSTPNGPWVVADKVPQEIYTIPPSSPMYHTTYVYVYDSTPDTVVVGYTPGYVGVYVADDVVVYGTGYYYSPYVWHGVYYPYPYTYGASVYYNPYTGTYARGAAYYGPYGGYGAGAVYNPTTGTYARGAEAYGPYGSVAAAQAYNPRTGTYAATYQASNVYGQWGQSVVTRGDDWAHTGHYTGSQGTVGAFDTSGGAKGVGYKGDDNSAGVAKSASGDVYAGRDGNVYKKDDDGWYKYDDGGWQPVDKSEEKSSLSSETGSERRSEVQTSKSTGSTGTSATREPPLRSENTSTSELSTSRRENTGGWQGGTTTEQLNNEALSRRDGEVRTNNFNSWRESGGFQGAGRTGFGGSGFRGGGFGGGRLRR